MADALKKTGMEVAEKGMIGQLYHSLLLYPKATSQIAKTILSPVTHMRNFISAGAFATANGIVPFADKERHQDGLPSATNSFERNTNTESNFMMNS